MWDDWREKAAFVTWHDSDTAFFFLKKKVG